MRYPPSSRKLWATVWKNVSTAASSCSCESRRAISSLCSGLSTTWAVEKDRFSRLRPRPPDSVLRSRFIRFSPSSWGIRAKDWSKWETTSPWALT